jgi:diguanylate cyclase (GGDEF)-like protein
MRWRSWAWSRFGGRSTATTRGRGEPGSQPRRSLGMTAALAAVLCGQGLFTLWGTLQTTQATATQQHALLLDATFGEARNAITVEEMYTRQYQLEPSGAGLARYVTAADASDEALRRAVQLSSGAAHEEAARLGTEQAGYRAAADKLIALVTDRDPLSVEHDRLDVAPAYYTLQQDIDRVSRAHHAEAQQLVAGLRRVQSRILATTGLGFVLGLALVAMIWRAMLGYQRRVLEHAAANQHLALHDPLTGLANRALFERRLRTSLEATHDDPSQGLAVMLIDLNGFKGVNDTLGHHAGDEVLVETGHRLRAVLRDDDIVARIGGDEFAVLLPTVATVEAAWDIAQRASNALRRNYVLSAGAAAVGGSVGFAVGYGGSDAEDLLRHADAAMYRAKSSGKGIAMYDGQLDADRPEQMVLFGDLRGLLDTGDPDGQLVLYYQPQVRLADATVTAAEALVRWRHPDRGLLLPAAFLPIAETGGLEIPLTYHLLRTAVREAARWHAEDRPLTISVNVSPNCLLDESFAARVSAALAEYRLPPGLLRLELTESAMMTDPIHALAVLRQLRRDGVQVSIDDFGTGFSSLSQLKRLTADELKIDRTFVKDLASDADDAMLVRSAIDLAHNLGLFVTAEGVEDFAALTMLRDLGCDFAQGFALARPVPADRLAATCVKAERAAAAVLLPTETDIVGDSDRATDAAVGA